MAAVAWHAPTASSWKEANVKRSSACGAHMTSMGHNSFAGLTSQHATERFCRADQHAAERLGRPMWAHLSALGPPPPSAPQQLLPVPALALLPMQALALLPVPALLLLGPRRVQHQGGQQAD